MSQSTRIATVTLNPAIDQTLSIPNFTQGEVNRVASQRQDAGGKGVNVAAFLADYGFRMAATGFLGAENPQCFERFFKEKAIEDHFIRLAGSTRSGIKIVDSVKNETTDINFPGLTPTYQEKSALFAKIIQLAADHHWFVLAGSLPTGIPPDTYAEMIRLINRQGAQGALDTSGTALAPALEAAPRLVKPNLEELETYAGRALKEHRQVIDAAQTLLARGIHTIVVSMGAKGALFVEEGAVLQAVPPKVQVRSTVGAGDAMLSGVLAAKIEGRTLAESARLATAFAVVAVSHIGAGLPDKAALSEILPRVTIQKL